MKKKENLKGKIRRALDIDDLVPCEDRLEMDGTNELCVSRVGRILFYSEDEIKLALRSYDLKISGNRLYCVSYRSGAVRVSGEIRTLEFERRAKK